MNDYKRIAWRPLRGILLVLLILGLAGTSFFFWKYDDVFPAASVDLKLSKQEVVAKAREFCGLVGFTPVGCIESTTFQERSETATFLEHEYSIKEANQLMHSDINVFYWYTRFCRPHKEEECQVWLNTDGRLAGLNRDIEKERAMPSIPQQDAMNMALKFVKDNAGVQLYSWLDADNKAPELLPGIKLIKQGSVKQQNRTDYYFTWEDQTHDYKGGHIRTTVDVSGNQVTAYDRELHVPEAFEHRFANIRSYNDLLKQVSSILFAIVGTGMGVAFLWALSTGRLRVRLVVIASAITFLVEFFDYWNNWPSLLQAYSTTESFQGFLTSKLISSVYTAASASLAAAFLVGGIEAVYRTKFPEKIAGEHYLNWKNFTNKTLLESVIAGICIFGIHLGYVAAYYLAGTKLGMWSPLEVRDVSTMSNISPAFSSFAVGVNASVSEELLYRVLCFVIAQKVFKNFWIANFVQAAGWAFMHSDYPQEPAYSRGVELTIVGLFYGYIMRRFGVLTGIISHFIYDAFLGITPLLLSQSAFLSTTGLLACVPPFFVLGMGLLRRAITGEELPDEPLLNKNLVQVDDRIPAEDTYAERHINYAPFSFKSRAVLLTSCLVSALVCACCHIHKIGDWAKLTTTKAQAISVAKSFLQERGIEEGDWKIVASMSPNLDDDEVQYAYEKAGFKHTEEVMRAARTPIYWWVRFFKPLQHREYAVMVSGEGRPLALNVTEEEDAPGKSITQDQAKKLTEEFLKRYRPEFLPLKFESVVEQKHKNRSDYTVAYVVPDFKIGDARLKVSVDTVGDIVSFPHVKWDIPDSWQFERTKKTMKDDIAKAAMKVSVFVAIVFFAIWAIGVFRSQAIHWRAAILSAGCVGLVWALNELNGLSALLGSYDTDVPYASFLTQIGVQGLVSTIFYSALFGSLVTIAHCAFRILCPGVTLRSLWHSLFRPPIERVAETRRLWGDGALAAYAWVFLLYAISVCSGLLLAKFSPEAQVQSLNTLTSATNYYSSAMDQLISASSVGFASLCLAPVVMGLYLKYFRSFWKYFAVMMVFFLIVGSTARHWQDYAVEIAFGAVDLVAFYCWIKYCARNNPVAYFLAGFLNSILTAMYYLFRFSSNVYSTDLCILAAVFAMPLFLPFVFGRAGNSRGRGMKHGEGVAVVQAEST